LCPPSAADVRIFVGSADIEEDVQGPWEILCDSAVLQQSSEYFSAALRFETWQEGHAMEFTFADDAASDWLRTLLHFHADSGQAILQQITGAGSQGLEPWALAASGAAAPLTPPADLEGAVRFLFFCRKYLLEELEQGMRRALRDDPARVEQVVSLCPAEFVELARDLAMLDMLPGLLGPWCLAARECVAPHIAALLRDKRLSKIALTSKGVTSFLASPAFLAAAGGLQPDGAVTIIAAAGKLDILTTCRNWSWIPGPEDLEQLLDNEELLPLLQVPSLRKELRHPRFKDVSLASGLAPFPSLFEDLLRSWFGSETIPESKLSPSDLVQWSSCRKFRREGLLDEQLAASSVEEIRDFAHAAPLSDADVAIATCKRLTDLTADRWENLWQELPRAEAAVVLLRDWRVLRRLWAHGALQPGLLMRLLSVTVVRACLAPLRAALRVRSALQLHGAAASSVLRAALVWLRAWLRRHTVADATFAHLVFASLLSVGALGLGRAVRGAGSTSSGHARARLGS